MKEIKYRAWNVRRFLKEDEFAILGNGKLVFLVKDGESDAEYREMDFLDVALMQYTGLTDRNGKEIYEGDILRYPPKTEWEKTNYVGFEVFFHDNDCAQNHIGFQMNRLHFFGSFGGYALTETFLPKYTSKMEVIGNIYETPELLEVT